MSEPSWVPLGGSSASFAPSIDYIGPWSSGVTYKVGDIVTYNGVQYMAVNPSTAQTPPPAAAIPGIGRGLALPASPVDGQEYVLVDSLTVPTFSWRFRYSSAVTGTYKWEFVGGAPVTVRVNTTELHPGPNGAFVNLTTPGPLFTVPRAGDYEASVTAMYVKKKAELVHAMAEPVIGDTTGSHTPQWMSYIAATEEGVAVTVSNPCLGMTAGQVIKARYYAATNSGTGPFLSYGFRVLTVTPLRVS